MDNRDQRAQKNPAVDYAALVERAKAKDQDAFTALYEATHQEVYRTVRAMVRTEELALDIQQDAYVFAFTHLDQLRDPAKFRPWLRAIATNRTRSVLRKQTAVLFTELETEDGEGFPELPDQSPESQLELSLERKENARLIREILDSLSDGQRLLVGMYYYEQIPVHKIAEDLGVSPSTVKTQLSRSRKKIESAVARLEKKGVKLFGLAPMPFLLALLKKAEPASETGKAVMAKTFTKAGIAPVAQAVGLRVGRTFFQTDLGRVTLGVITAGVIGGGALGYGWVRDNIMTSLGDTQPPVSVESAEDLTTEPSETLKWESPEDLTTEPLETVAPLDTPEDLTEPTTEPTEPSTEPTEPSTEPTEPGAEPTGPEPSQPAAPEPTQPTQPPQPQPTDPELTEPSAEPSEPTPPEEPTRIACSDTDVRIEKGSWCYYHVNVVGGAVPTLYTDHPELLRIEYQGTYIGGNLKSGETGHHWKIDALDVGTASLFCTIDGQTQTAGTVTVPLPAVDWNPNMPPVTDVIIDFEEETEP